MRLRSRDSPPSAVAGVRPGRYNFVMAVNPQPRREDGGALTTRIADETAMAALADAVAPLALRGDVLALRGPLGAGKTVFARAFIAARARAAGLDPDALGEMPSPTFTLVQSYELPDVPIWHFDLFRLEKPEDALELAIEEAFATAISLIEWPEKLGATLPVARLDLAIDFLGGDGARQVALSGGGAWPARLARLAVLRAAP